MDVVFEPEGLVVQVVDPAEKKDCRKTYRCVRSQAKATNLRGSLAAKCRVWSKSFRLKAANACIHSKQEMNGKIRGGREGLVASWPECDRWHACPDALSRCSACTTPLPTAPTQLPPSADTATGVARSNTRCLAQEAAAGRPPTYPEISQDVLIATSFAKQGRSQC